VQDLISRSKLFFWAFVLAFAALAAVPSIVLVDTLQRYFQFLSGWDPGTLRAVQVRRLPPRDGTPGGHKMPELRFVTFRLKAPKAKRVFLAGDFNQWNPSVLPLNKGSKGVWETLLPLPAGKYDYLFQVDGVWTPDPEAPRTGTYGSLRTCVRQVP